MKIWAAGCAAGAAFVLSYGIAQASTWVQIGAAEYLDTASIERSGDEVSYNIFTVTGIERPNDTSIGLRYTLNCKTRFEEPADDPSQSDTLSKNEPIYRRLCLKKK